MLFSINLGCEQAKTFQPCIIRGVPISDALIESFARYVVFRLKLSFNSLQVRVRCVKPVKVQGGGNRRERTAASRGPAARRPGGGEGGGGVKQKKAGSSPGCWRVCVCVCGVGEA